MKSIKHLSWWMLLATAVVFVLVYALLHVPANEGFNPSDDGVIIAQAYRLLQGQIPHHDFISIRPVGSAVIHSIHFYSFLPFEISARWFTLLEYMAYSFLWTLLFVRSWKYQSRITAFVLPVLLGSWVFILNQNHYNLFPWTSIDAIMLFSVALFVYLKHGRDFYHSKYAWIRLSIIIFFAVSASLCRQSFAFPLVILVIVILVYAVRKNKLISSLSALFIGAAPAWVYLIVLLKHRALGEFLSQMTGRTELWQTGIAKFGYEFWHSPVLILYFILVILILYQRLVQKDVGIMRRILNSGGWFDQLIIAVSVVAGFMVFIRPGQLFHLSFILFWLLLLQLLLALFRENMKGIAIKHAGWVIIIAWTSAISLGDNAPVFTIGLLIGSIFIISMPNVRTNRAFTSTFRQFRYPVLFLFTIVFVIVGIKGQLHNNYRDLPAGSLHFGVSDEYPEMGEVRTNQRVFSYMQDIKRIYTELGEPAGRFVVLPNASLIYPLLHSPDPFPLDWMQEPEFVGQDSIVTSLIRQVIKNEEIYILFDKFNSKLLADTLIEMVYDPKVYPYYEGLVHETEHVKIVSKWFELRKSQ
ncbi:MAG: hypothetical protein J7L96_01595 [Bacteroidales bacterium]|nr:hypothetical protein [Bacteroidales bacterium]